MWAPSLCLRASLGTPSAGAPPGSLSPAWMKGQTQTVLWSCQTPCAPRAQRAPHPGDRAVSETPGTKTARESSKKPPAQTPDQGLGGGRKGHASGWASKARRDRRTQKQGPGKKVHPGALPPKRGRECHAIPSQSPSSCVRSLPQPTNPKTGAVSSQPALLCVAVWVLPTPTCTLRGVSPRESGLGDPAMGPGEA